MSEPIVTPETRRLLLAAPVALLVWSALYWANEPFAAWVTFDLLGLSSESSTGEALKFFLYDTVKILLLLVLMVYVLAFCRASLNVERVRAFLSGKNRLVGYGAGALFGAVTPFCSCSSVPLFIGFTMGGIPLGITMAFLITSPVINEVAVVLLWGFLGPETTLLYVVVGLTAGIAGGMLMDAFRAERWLQPFLLEALKRGEKTDTRYDGESLTFVARHRFAVGETCDIFRRVWVWVIAGVGIGALLHGFVPEDWIAANLGSDNLAAVPAAVLLGIPLYTNVTGVVPVMESLLAKGLPLGTTLAFTMSTVAASLPEAMMLKQVMRPRLIALFLGVLVVIFTLVGWTLNALT